MRQSRPEVRQSIPDIRQSRPDIRQSRPDIRQSRLDIRQSRPDTSQPRPEKELKDGKWRTVSAKRDGLYHTRCESERRVNSSRPVLGFCLKAKARFWP